MILSLQRPVINYKTGLLPVLFVFFDFLTPSKQSGKIVSLLGNISYERIRIKDPARGIRKEILRAKARDGCHALGMSTRNESSF